MGFGDNAKTYSEAATVQHQVADNLAQYIGSVKDSRLLEIGCGTGFLTLNLLKTSPASILAVDSSPEMLAQLSFNIGRHAQNCSERVSYLCVNAEHYLFAADKFDAMVSSSAVQWYANPLYICTQAKQCIRHGGIMALATYLPGTYQQVAHLGKGLDYCTVEQWKSELSDGFKVLTFNVQTIVQDFESLKDMLMHIKQTGVQGQNTKKVTFKELRQLPHQLTYNILYIVAKVK